MIPRLLTFSSQGGVAITPSDTIAIETIAGKPTVFRALTIGTGGDGTVTMIHPDGSTIQRELSAGLWPYSFTHVKSGGTNATKLIAER